MNDGVMDHYDFPKTKESTLAELPKGKKCFPGWQPGGAQPLAEGQLSQVPRVHPTGTQLHRMPIRAPGRGGRAPRVRGMPYGGRW